MSLRDDLLAAVGPRGLVDDAGGRLAFGAHADAKGLARTIGATVLVGLLLFASRRNR